MKIPLTPVRLLRYARGQFPEKVGVVYGEQRSMYAQFAERAAHLAGALLDAGAQPLGLGQKYWRAQKGT